MNNDKLFLCLLNYIFELDVLDIDLFIRKRSTITDFVLGFYNSQAIIDRPFNSRNVTSLLTSSVQVDLLSKALALKFERELNIDFRTTIYNTISKQVTFKYKDLADMKNNEKELMQC